MQNNDCLNEMLLSASELFDASSVNDCCHIVYDSDVNLKVRQEWRRILVELLLDSRFNKEEKIYAKQKMLLILADNTGCMEDQELSDKQLKMLIDGKFIDGKDVLVYETNKMTNRWE